jgi:kinetochore protein NNF1
MPFLAEHTTLLNTQLAATQDANRGLLEEVEGQRAEIEALVRGLEVVVKDLENSAHMMGGEDVQGLSAEVRDIEAEMKK